MIYNALFVSLSLKVGLFSNVTLGTFIAALVREKGSVESDIVNRPRTESESSNHSNPEEMLPDQNILQPEKEDFIVKVNVATELKELRKKVEELQHKKRLKESALKKSI